jgi:hypothetical protein
MGYRCGKVGVVSKFCLGSYDPLNEDMAWSGPMGIWQAIDALVDAKQKGHMACIYTEAYALKWGFVG